MKYKSWIIGLISFFAGVIVTIIGFVVLTIYIAFIQEKVEEPTDEEVIAIEEAQALEISESSEWCYTGNGVTPSLKNNQRL